MRRSRLPSPASLLSFVEPPPAELGNMDRVAEIANGQVTPPPPEAKPSDSETRAKYRGPVPLVQLNLPITSTEAPT